MKNNLDIAIANYNPKTTAEGIIIAKAVFDPVASLTADANRTKTPTSTVLAAGTANTLTTKNVDLNASLTQALPFGARYTLGLTNKRFDTSSAFANINPSYKTVFTLSVAQDLLKNFGPDVNTAPIKIARNNQAISVTQLRQQANQVITNGHIISQVREGVRRIEADIRRVEATRAARALAEEQLRVERKRLEAGVTTTFNVLSFQRDLAAAQASEIQAITAYNQDLANLEFVKGTVLEANRLEL